MMEITTTRIGWNRFAFFEERGLFEHKKDAVQVLLKVCYELIIKNIPYLVCRQYRTKVRYRKVFSYGILN